MWSTFFKKNLEEISLFRGATDTTVLDFWWCLPWVSKPGWIPFACFLARVIFRFTSGTTLADCIEVSMAAKPFWSTYLQMCLKVLVEVWGSNPRLSVPHAANTALFATRPLRLGMCNVFVPCQPSWLAKSYEHSQFPRKIFLVKSGRKWLLKRSSGCHTNGRR